MLAFALAAPSSGCGDGAEALPSDAGEDRGVADAGQDDGPSTCEWTLEIADPADVGPFMTGTPRPGGGRTSAAVDASGGVHVSYYDYRSRGLRYAYRPAGGSWTLSAVDTPGYDGTHGSLALDAAGGAHLAYCADSSGELGYAYQPEGGSWTLSVVDSQGSVGQFAALAVDALGGVHVSYQDYSNLYSRSLKYAYRPAGGSWSSSTVDSAGDVGYCTALGVDGVGGVHVSYSDYSALQLKHAYKPAGGEWSVSAVDATGDSISYTALAVDGADGVHVSYVTGYPSKDLKYAYRSTSGSWTPSTVDSASVSFSVSGATSIAVTESGGVHVVYSAYDSWKWQLCHAYRPAGGSWTSTIVSADGDSEGLHASLALDASGGLHVSYYNLDGNLAYAYRPPCR